MPARTDQLDQGPGVPRDGSILIWIGQTPLPLQIRNHLLSVLDLQGGEMRNQTLNELVAYLRSGAQPVCIATPLFWSGGDVIVLAGALREAGYRGAVRALTPPIPDSEMICREVRAQYPGLDFSLIEVGTGRLRAT